MKNKFIVFQRRKSLSRDQYGELTETPFVDWAEAYAEINPLHGEETSFGSATQSTITHEIKVWYLEGVTPNMRVVYDGRFFEIVSIANAGEMNMELILKCKETFFEEV